MIYTNDPKLVQALEDTQAKLYAARVLLQKALEHLHRPQRPDADLLERIDEAIKKEKP